MFDGTFPLYQTDNIFRFIEKTEKDRISISGIRRIGRINPNVKIRSTGVVVGVLNKKEGLFVCKKYPVSIFKFPIKNLTK